MPLSEVIMSTSETTFDVHTKVKDGVLRKIAPTLYTSNMTDPPEAIIKRNAWRIVGLFCPGAIITDRTGIENRAASDGSVFVIHERRTDVVLPGLRIRPRKGPPATEEDRTFLGGLRMASSGRALLENLVPSRARSGVSRTLSRAELEAYLEKILAREGGNVVLNKMREEARRVAPVLGLNDQMKELDRLIGALLGTQEDKKITAPTALARVAGRPYDTRRLEILDALRVELRAQAPTIIQQPPLEPVGHDNLAFFESYFSNFIEGTEFDVEEAADIVFNNVIPPARPADAHYILGTFRVAASRHEMSRVPQSFDQFLAIMKGRHAVIMEERPEKQPGEFKTEANRAGMHVFAQPELVVGTLEKGFEMCQSLTPGFERAAFMMYLVATVHPFVDGNGRTARLTMNAELVAANEQRIIIPIVYRENYLAALRTLSDDGNAQPYVRMLDFAQQYTRMIPWNSFEQARHVMTATNAFMRATEAEAIGLRLRKPTQAQLQAAEDAHPIEETDAAVPGR
jgi:hypothetical protein